MEVFNCHNFRPKATQILTHPVHFRDNLIQMIVADLIVRDGVEMKIAVDLELLTLIGYSSPEQQFLFTLLNFTLIWILYVGVTSK